jgi:hypothetical protein
MNRYDISPDFAPIEQHIRNANLERAAYIGALFAKGAAAVSRGLKRLGAAMERGYAEELDRRAIEADAFQRRSVPRY